MIDALEEIEYKNGTELFHELPIIIYILKQYILDTMQKKEPLNQFE